MKSRITIQDIAAEAQCSTTTVSFVINGRDCNISDETRNRVIETARKLHYRPNGIAASLVTGNTKTIGMIVPDNRNPMFGSILRHAQLYAEQKGYRLLICNSDDKASKDLEYIDMLMDYRVDGILIVRSNPKSESDKEQISEQIYSLNVPVVAVDRNIEGVNIPFFSINNKQGGYIATKHILEKGHRRIGCYTGPLTVSSAQQRLEGYKEALKEFGIPYDHDLVFEGDYTIDRSEEAFNYFSERGVFAIFSQNDMQAYGLYRSIQARGKSIPNDFSIVGFDNLEFSSIIVPGLTSVRFPIENIARDSIDCLISMIESGGEFNNREYNIQEYESELVLRESVKDINDK